MGSEACRPSIRFDLATLRAARDKILAEAVKAPEPQYRQLVLHGREWLRGLRLGGVMTFARTFGLRGAEIKAIMADPDRLWGVWVRIG